MLWTWRVTDPENDGSVSHAYVGVTSSDAKGRRRLGPGVEARFAPDGQHVLWLASRRDPAGYRGPFDLLRSCVERRTPATVLQNVSAFAIAAGTSPLPPSRRGACSVMLLLLATSLLFVNVPVERPLFLGAAALAVGLGLEWLWVRQFPWSSRDAEHHKDLTFLIRLLGWEELAWGVVLGALVFSEAQIGLLLDLLAPVVPQPLEDWGRKHHVAMALGLSTTRGIMVLAARAPWLESAPWLPLTGSWRHLLLATAGISGLLSMSAGWLPIECLAFNLPNTADPQTTLMCRAAAALLSLNALLIGGTLIWRHRRSPPPRIPRSLVVRLWRLVARPSFPVPDQPRKRRAPR